MSADPERQDAISRYTESLLESRNWEVKLKNLRLEIKGLEKDFNQTEENIKALQSVGQIIGEVLKQLDDERCQSPSLYPRTLAPNSTANTLFPASQSSSRPPPVPAMSSVAAPRSTRPSSSRAPVSLST